MLDTGCQVAAAVRVCLLCPPLTQPSLALGGVTVAGCWAPAGGSARDGTPDLVNQR